jgi:hypothetical protein
MTDDVDFPPVTPGVKVRIQLKSGRYYQADADGNRIGPDHFLPTPVTELTVRDRDECFPDNWDDDYETPDEAMHCQTICPECIPTWAIDYYVVLAE